MFIIFRWDVVTTRLKHVFDIEWFIQEISIVNKYLWRETPTPSFIYFDFVKMNIYIYIYIKDSINEHFVRTTSKLCYFVRESWSPIYLKKTDSQFVQNRAALVYMLFISLLHIIS